MMRFCGLVCEQRSYRRAIEITTETSFQKIGMIWGSNCRNDFLFLHNLALAGRAFQTKQPWKAGLRKPDSLLIGSKTNAWELEPLVLRPLLARAWKISLIWLLQQLFWVRQTNTHSFFNILVFGPLYSRQVPLHMYTWRASMQNQIYPFLSNFQDKPRKLSRLWRFV